MQAFHQQGADEIWGNLLGGAGEEGLGKALGERGGYGCIFRLSREGKRVIASKVKPYVKHGLLMQKVLALALCTITLAAASQAPSWSWEYGYDQICFFNNTPKKCAVNHGYRIPLARGSDVDIHWLDGQLTTVNYLNSNGPLRKGSKVVINGKSSGIVVSIFNNTRGGKEIDNYVKIKSSTGNSFAYQYMMD